MVADARRALGYNPRAISEASLHYPSAYAPIDYPLEYHPSTAEPIHSASIPSDAQLLPTVMQSIAMFAAAIGLAGGVTILIKQDLEEMFGVPIQELHQLLMNAMKRHSELGLPNVILKNP
jgi:hypothetical protein